MRHLKIVTIFLILFATACSKKNQTAVELTDKNFEEEVPISGNLVFTFDQNLVSDTLLNYWDEEQYITFSPEIEGRFKWTAPNELTFSPVAALKPSTTYTGRINDAITSNSDGLNIAGERDFSFHTPYLQLDGVNAYWSSTSPDAKNAYAHFNLDFNYPVNASEVSKLLNLQVDGQPANFKLTSDQVGQTVTVYLPDQKAEDKTYEATIKLNEGLKPVNGQIALDASAEKEIEIPSPFKLTISDITASHNGVVGEALVSTSQAINQSNYKKFIAIKPKVKYTVGFENQGFTIKSEDFDVNTTYEISIQKNLKGKFGGQLKHDFTKQLSFGQLDPSIRFADKKGVYLSGKGNKNLAVNIINVPKVKVKVLKVYENNILAFLGNDYYSYDYDDYYYDYYGGDRGVGTYGDVVWEGTYNSKDMPRSGSQRVLNLDFQDKIKDYQGLYVVEVSSEDSYWLKDSKTLAISDIGLIAKKGKNSVSVFANSVKNATPLANVNLKLIGRNNQEVAQLTTDANGVAIYNHADLQADGFDINMITATLQGDFNYLPFRRTQVNTSRFDIGGRVPNLSGYDAYIYGERDIYRPGETMNLTAIIRNNEWKVPGKIPVILKIISPNGQEFKTIRKTLNEQGSFETQIALSAASLTGSYSAQVYTSNNILLNSKSIAVEEFVPDRIKVTAKLSSEEAKVGEAMEVGVNAVNFFGPPAANRSYEMDFSTKRKYFAPDQNSDFNYSPSGINTYFENVVRSGDTDADGNANERFTIPKNYAHMGVLQTDVYITVFDETGRPVNTRKSFPTYTQDVFYGLKMPGYYTKTNNTMKMPLIAVDKNGKALSGVQASVKIIKHEYKTVLQKSGNYFRYRSEKEEKVLENRIVNLSGNTGTYNFTPEVSGRYEIRISAPGVNSYVGQEFYAYGWGSTSFSSFQVNNEGQIDITLDKDKYEVGEKAKVIMKTPFSGKVLVTVESDKVLDYFYMDTDKRAVSFDLDIKDSQVPNVYISATLFRPHEASDLPLTVANGFAPVLVENKTNILPLEITAANNSRSNKSQKIKIKSAPNTKLTVSVVDEGILQLTGYQTPNPYDFFYAKRALGMNSYNIYPYLFPEVVGSSKTGGDGMMEMNKRVNPLTNKRIKLVSFWSGILQTDSKRKCRF